MSVIALPSEYKVGSTWTFVVRRTDSAKGPIDLTGLSTRAMFREGSATGPVIATLTGRDRGDAGTGQAVLTLTPEQTALFTPGSKVVFDVEMSRPGYAWQSPTYRIKTEAEVTRG